MSRIRPGRPPRGGLLTAVFGGLVSLGGLVGLAGPSRAAGDPTVVVSDPARTELGPEALVLTSETLAFREYRDLLERVPRPEGESVGGPAMIGIEVGGPSQLRRSSLPEELQESLLDWDGWGAAVLRVLPGSPSEAAWLQPGDVIVRYSGIWVDGPDMLIRLATRSQPGRELELWYLRGGQVYQTWLEPGYRDRVSAEAVGPVQPIEDVILEAGRKGLVMPVLLDDVIPDYPSLARRAKASGTGVYRVVVGTSGQVQDVRVRRSAGRDDLDEAALEALRLRSYEPGRVQGRPIAVGMELMVSFAYQGLPEPAAEGAELRPEARAPRGAPRGASRKAPRPER